MKLLVCNVSWMKAYNGISKNDKPVRGGEYIKENGYGHEVLNFQNLYRHVYGYTQAKNGTININRLGADSEDEYIDGVTVFWRAASINGSVIIGWYKNARVFRNLQDAPKERSFKYNGQTIRPGYFISAKSTDASLLNIQQRNLRFPTTNKGFGSQTFVSYLQSDGKGVDAYIDKLMKLVNGEHKSPTTKNRKNIDNERKVKIEKSAIQKAIEYYEDLDYKVVSVESENIGYDLVAKIGKSELLIEVKGTSVTGSIQAGLTPNEYSVFSKTKENYRIVVISNALENPRLDEFYYDSEENAWISENIKPNAKIIEAVSAIIKFKIDG